MQQTFFTMGAAVLLTLAPSVLAIGTAHVINNCSFPIYYASIAQNVHSEMKELPTDGFSEPFSLPNVGVSIKIAKSLTEKPTQFEYTWANGVINYDLSNIDGNPFKDDGMLLSPSTQDKAAHPTCLDVACRPGESPCLEAYNLPDDVRTMVCPQEVDLTLTLCPTSSVLTPVSRLAASITHRHKRTHPRHLPRA